MPSDKDANVHGEEWAWPIGERSTIVIRSFPDHDDLAELHVYFVTGTRVAGYQPLDVAAIADQAIAGRAQFGRELQYVMDMREVMADLRAKGIEVRDTTIAEDLRSLRELFPLSDEEQTAATRWARRRNRQRRVADEKLLETMEAWEKHGTAEKAAEQLGISSRTVFKHREMAEERGLIERRRQSE